MFSSSPLRRSSPSIQRLLNNHRRSLPHQPYSSSSSSSSSGNGGGQSGNASSKLFSRSLSGALVIGSGLGVWYWSYFDKGCFLPFADASEQKSLVADPAHLRDSSRRSDLFKQERTIRVHNSPDKVFEYFASVHKHEGEAFMTPADLMRAVVPVFPPSKLNGNAEESPKGLCCAPSKFFMLFDTNNDGLISFPEYLFFISLLGIPESSFQVAFKMFDLDNDGEIEREEFKKVTALLQSQNTEGSRMEKKSAESVENGGIVEYLFGKNGKKRLKHEKFVQFLRDFQEEILRLEFEHYDYASKGSISAEDFALSMAASADTRHLNKFLDLVDELKLKPNFIDVRITFKEFKDFASVRKKLHFLSQAIFSYGKDNATLSKWHFKRAVFQVCRISLADNVVDIIFHMFDTNRDGNIGFDEFLNVLRKREQDVARSRQEAGLWGLITCWRGCTTNCLFS